MKVSVSIVTYNHEEYIAKALESILMQRTNFDYEIVIGEDCSSDNTREIIVGYQKKYPDKFRLLLNEKNLGMHANGAQVLDACKGEYISMLDGDDYWTSPDKLQKQVDFLDNHPECSACFHDALIVHEDGSREPASYRPSQKEFSGVEDLLLDNFIPTSATMFRKGLFGKAEDWTSPLKMGDWLIHILNALHGKIGYLDETMSVYVVHRGGVWSTKDWRYHATAIIELFEALALHLPSRYTGIINRILRWRYYWVSEQYENTGNVSASKTYAIKSIAKHLSIISNPFRNRIDPGTAASMPDYITSVKSAKLFRCLLRLYVVPVLKPHAPALYSFLRAGCCRTLGIFGIRF